MVFFYWLVCKMVENCYTTATIMSHVPCQPLAHNKWVSHRHIQQWFDFVRDAHGKRDVDDEESIHGSCWEVTLIVWAGSIYALLVQTRKRRNDGRAKNKICLHTRIVSSNPTPKSGTTIMILDTMWLLFSFLHGCRFPVEPVSVSCSTPFQLFII